MGQVELNWPPYFEPTVQDVQGAVTAASMGVQGQVIDKETAVHFVAPYFGVQNEREMKARLDKEQAQADAQANQMAMQGVMRGVGGA